MRKINDCSMILVFPMVFPHVNVYPGVYKSSLTCFVGHEVTGDVSVDFKHEQSSDDPLTIALNYHAMNG